MLLGAVPKDRGAEAQQQGRRAKTAGNMVPFTAHFLYVKKSSRVLSP
jgi:hypothetical protein